MDKSNPGFFQILGLLTLSMLLAFLVWVNAFLGNPASWAAMAATWAAVFVVAALLRLFSLRPGWSSAIETAWLAWLGLGWLLILLDTGLCSTPGLTACKPASIFNLIDIDPSMLTHSYLLMAIPLSALCFPWGVPLLYGWMLWLPKLFAMADMAMPDPFSPLGRFCLMFPAVLMVPLGYWFWFLLIPKLAKSTWRAFRIDQIRRTSVSFVTRTRQKVTQSTLALWRKLRRKPDDEPASDKKPAARRLAPKKR